MQSWSRGDINSQDWFTIIMTQRQFKMMLQDMLNRLIIFQCWIRVTCWVIVNWAIILHMSGGLLVNGTVYKHAMLALELLCKIIDTGCRWSPLDVLSES